MAKHTFEVSISREQIIRVVVDDEDIEAGETLEDVAEEYALDGSGKIVHDDYTVEEVSAAVEGRKAA